MSKCSEIQILTDKALEEGVSHSERGLIEEHIKKCEKCAELSETALTVMDTLAGFSPDEFEPPETFRSDLHKKLTKKTSKMIPYLSVAAAALIFVAVGLFYFLPEEKKDVSEGVQVAKAEVKRGVPVTIELEYISKDHKKDVEVEITLSEGVVFHTLRSEFAALKKHTWRGDLKKGSNKIPFVVDIVKDGNWKIMTNAKYGGYTHPHRIELSADGERVAIVYFKLPEKKIDETL